MLELIKQVLGRKSYPLNRIEVSKQALINNYSKLSAINPKVKIVPVLKSNAYGHGINLVGQILKQVQDDMPFIAVDSLYEANQLKKAGVKSQILIMGYIDPQSLRGRRLPYAYAAWGLDFLKEIDTYQKGAEVHLFIDTGMHREGVQIEELPQFLEDLKQFKNIKVVGVMTHLAIGGEPDNKITKLQILNFKKAVKMVKKAGFKIKWVHLGGSNAILHNNNLGINVARVGLALYGYDPQGQISNIQDQGLVPVLKVISKIAQIKEVPKGAPVGYNAAFKAAKKMTIGVLPIGYNDGVDRRLSGKGMVLVDGIPYKILGYLSMNMTTIDLTNVKKPYVGQEVVVFSDNLTDPNSFPNTAKKGGTTVYDLLIRLNPSTKRVLS